MVAMHSLVAALAIRASHAWVTTSQQQKDSSAKSLAGIRASNGNINRVWTLPPAATASAGLGGGLTFAYDSKICDELLPAMSEASGLWGISFVDCDSIYAAIRSAFASWTVNHPDIKFHDVTSDCRALSDTEGGPFGRGCSRAEIFLTTTTNSSAQDAAATTINQFQWDPAFHHPNGRRASPGVYATIGSIVSFTTGSFSEGKVHDGSICWYIDSSFCSGFHRLKAEVR